MKIPFWVLLLSSMLAACSGVKKYNLLEARETVSIPAVYAPWESREAAWMALCLTGDLVPPEGLEARILADLRFIRSRFGREALDTQGTPGLPRTLSEIRFIPPWEPGALDLHFQPEAYGLLLRSEYSAWNDINATLQINRIETQSSATAAAIYYKNMLHPRRLAELYRRLPGIEQAEPLDFIGAGSRIYPRKVGDRITYLFDKAWEDCIPSCRMHEYWYFSAESNGKIRYHGFWNPEMSSVWPSWWAEARENLKTYIQL